MNERCWIRPGTCWSRSFPSPGSHTEEKIMEELSHIFTQ